MGIHAAFQVAWALAIAVLLATKVRQLVDRPSSGAALTIIEVSGSWAVLAGIAWMLRVVALTSCGRWGARTRQRVRGAGPRQEAPR